MPLRGHVLLGRGLRLHGPRVLLLRAGHLCGQRGELDIVRQPGQPRLSPADGLVQPGLVLHVRGDGLADGRRRIGLRRHGGPRVHAVPLRLLLEDWCNGADVYVWHRCKDIDRSLL